MSNKMITAVWEHSQQTGTALLALLSLADRADDDGFCWPSHTDTAKRARVDRTYIAGRIVPKLIVSGELYCHRRLGTSSQYLVITNKTAKEVADAMRKRFDYTDDEIALHLVAITDENPDLKMVQDLQGVLTKCTGGVLTEYTGGVDGRQHGPSLTPKCETKNTNSAFGLQASSVEDETKHEKKRKAKPARPQAILQIEDILGRTFDESLWSTIQDKITLPIDAVRLYQTFAFRMAEGYFPRDANKWMDDYATNAHYHRERNKEIFKYLGNEPANMPYHAAIRAMAEIIGYNPDWILHAAIVAAMEVAGGIDKPRLKQCYADWCARGYNKYNLEGWYFERYVQERPYAGIGE